MHRKTSLSRSHATLLAGLTTLLAGLTTLLVLAPAGQAANGESTPLNLDSAPARAAETAGTGGSGVVRTIIGLAVVIGVIYGLTWVLKSVKRAREAQASGTALHALATLPLGPNRSLHLVRAGDVVVLLGVGEGGVTAIRTYHQDEARELGLLAAEPALGPLGAATVTAGLPGAAEPGGGRVARALDALRRRTVIK